jgi:hypothetical protein
VTGVEFASSEPLSADEGRTVGISVDEVGEGRSWPLVSGGFWFFSNRWRALADSFSTTVKELEFLAPLERPFVGAGMMREDGIVGREVIQVQWCVGHDRDVVSLPSRL